MKKKTKVDEDKCIGCGLCVTIDPDTFELDPETGKSKVKNPQGKDDKKTEEAEENCPVDAISIEEE